MINFKWLMLLTGLISCGPIYKVKAHVPMVPRPDTRKIVWVSLDSGVLASLLTNFEAAMPNETVMCIEGKLSEVGINGVPALRVTITKVIPAVVDSATPYNAYMSGKPMNGCESTPDLIGIAHDHVVPGQCNQSDPDANLLFVDRRLLFGLVFCMDGWTQILYQDGRRGLTRWK